MAIQKDVELQGFNTFNIKAKAKKFISLNSKESACNFFKNEFKAADNFLILGGGSNLLITKDFEGTVIKNEINGIEITEENSEQVIVKVGAGENWHQFVMHCIENGWAGIENLSLIPGNVGASPMQNIGAYGVEVKEVIEFVEAIKLDSGEIYKFSNKECEFGYRTSIFKTSHKNQYFISGVCFKLNKKPSFKISYGAIQDELNKMGISEDKLTVKAISEAVIAIRQSKLPDPKEIGNSGSFFKNPIVNIELAEKIKSNFPNVPTYPINEKEVKIAAGWMIEQAGWKGYKEGDFGVHTKQALVLVNYGSAKGMDIFRLSEQIINSVEEKFGVRLEREVNII